MNISFGIAICYVYIAPTIQLMLLLGIATAALLVGTTIQMNTRRLSRRR